MTGHRAHVCQHCGTTAPRDAIRLSQGRRYCPTGDCRHEAERIMVAAQSPQQERKVRCPFSTEWMC